MTAELHDAKITIQLDKGRNMGYFNHTIEHRDSETQHISIIRWHRSGKHPHVKGNVFHTAIVHTGKNTPLGENIILFRGKTYKQFLNEM